MAYGTVKAWDEENWFDEYGTAYYTGQDHYKGDVALIRLDGGRDSSARIYVGGPDSETSKLVTAIWSRGPVTGDQYWVGGKTSGDVGVFEVENTRIDVYYFNLGSWAREMIEGSKNNSNGCVNGGDSGGPVFTYRNDGSVAAKGVQSGGASIISSCYDYFTNVRLSEDALPGIVKLAS
jgi:V8-like Glu-specific endopeptidase